MKAILILDEMPESCEDCPLYPLSDEANKDGFGGYNFCMSKEEYCPLLEVPEPKIPIPEGYFL